MYARFRRQRLHWCQLVHRRPDSKKGNGSALSARCECTVVRYGVPNSAVRGLVVGLRANRSAPHTERQHA
jgi:hypothetical protein